MSKNTSVRSTSYYFTQTSLHNVSGRTKNACKDLTTKNNIQNHITFHFLVLNLVSCMAAWRCAMFYCTNFLHVIYSQGIWTRTLRIKSHSADLYSVSHSLRKSRAIRRKDKRDDLSSSMSQEVVRGRWVTHANLWLRGVLISFGTQH